MNKDFCYNPFSELLPANMLALKPSWCSAEQERMRARLTKAQSLYNNALVKLGSVLTELNNIREGYYLAEIYRRCENMKAGSPVKQRYDTASRVLEMTIDVLQICHYQLYHIPVQLSHKPVKLESDEFCASQIDTVHASVMQACHQTISAATGLVVCVAMMSCTLPGTVLSLRFTSKNNSVIYLVHKEDGFHSVYPCGKDVKIMCSKLTETYDEWSIRLLNTLVSELSKSVNL